MSTQTKEPILRIQLPQLNEKQPLLTDAERHAVKEFLGDFEDAQVCFAPQARVLTLISPSQGVRLADLGAHVWRNEVHMGRGDDAVAQIEYNILMATMFYLEGVVYAYSTTPAKAYL